MSRTRVTHSWMKRAVLALVFLIVALLSAISFLVPPRLHGQRNVVAPYPKMAVSAEAATLHEQQFIADLHCDALLWDHNLMKRSTAGHVDIPRLQEGNVGLQVFAAVTSVPRRGRFYRGDLITPLVIAQRWSLSAWFSPFERALYQARKLERLVQESGGALTPVHSRQDLEDLIQRREQGGNSVGAVLAVEGLHILQEAGDVARLFESGYRIFGVVHRFDCAVGGSSESDTNTGLTPFGRETIRRLERYGAILDLAHASERTFNDLLDATDLPVMVSHTGVCATYPTPRNLTDAQIRAVSARDGIIGIGYWPHVLGETTPEAFLRAVQHAVAVAGIEHVALGSDWDGDVPVLLGASDTADITQTLLAGGFTDDEVCAIMGENVLRFMQQHLPED